MLSTKSGLSTPSSRSTQEQLRLDHIESLELLQKFKNENAQLKRELRALKGENVAQDREVADEKGIANDSSDILLLAEQNAKQAEEIKLLKTRINQADVELLKLRQGITSAQQAGAYAAEDKMKKREAEMTNALLELEKSLKIAQQEATTAQEFRQRCTELEAHNAELSRQGEVLKEENKRLESSLMSSEGASAKMVRSLEAEMAELKSKHQQCVQSMSEKRSKLEAELQSAQTACDIATSSQRDQAATIAQQEALLAAMQAQLSTQQRTIHDLQASVDTLRVRGRGVEEESTMVYGDSDTESGPNDTFPFTAPPAISKSAPPSRPTTTASPTRISAHSPSEESGEQSFRFDEYLRLKRENKELKMRLAEMSSGTGMVSLVGGAGGSSNGSIGGAFGSSREKGMLGQSAASRSSGSLAPLVSPRLHSAAGSLTASSGAGSVGRFGGAAAGYTVVKARGGGGFKKLS